MARQDLSRHQEKIVKRYYEHQQTIQSNKLGELLSELWLASADPGGPGVKRLWSRTRAALLKLGSDPQRVAQACDGRNVEAVARLIEEAEARSR